MEQEKNMENVQRVNPDIKFDYNNMMKEFVGEEQGIGREDFRVYGQTIRGALDAVKESRGKGMTGWMDLPYNQKELLEDIQKAARRIRHNYNCFVVLGICGSALGTSAVFQALKHMHHNELKSSKRKSPKFYVEDNIDPERLRALLDVINPGMTMFNVITKSGATSETLAQFLIIADILKKEFGLTLRLHMKITTTGDENSSLMKIARQEEIQTFVIPEGVGGRFSVLSPVGLLPAAALNLNIKKLLKGAARMDKRCQSPNLYKNPALMAAALSYMSMKKGKNISVMMPYADSLKGMADFYAQLWGESLGKKADNDGNKVYAGQTPVKSLGVTDQHSQLQLYMEGPFDKVITFLAAEKYRTEFPVPQGYNDFKDVSFLGGHTLNELISAELSATEYALTAAKRPNNKIILPEIDEYSIGQLLYFYQMQTAFCGAMLNINAYNQPGVEESKKATFALLNREGYRNKRDEIYNAPRKREDYII